MNLWVNDRFDLSEHPVANKLVLPDCHKSNNFDEFCHAVANTSDGLQILHLLIGFIKYDVKIAEQYTK